MRRILKAVVVVTLVAVAACSGDDSPSADGAASTTSVSVTSSTVPASTSTTAAPIAWPALPADGAARAVVTPTGVLLAVLGGADGAWVVRTPCGNQATVAGTPLGGATVVLDPGHGGSEVGAVGPGGTQEKVVNLAIAERAKGQLEALGATVVLTRTGDYRITLASRAAIVTALQPAVFVSIHHNADPDGPNDGPGAETYYQRASADSKRAAGLVWEELATAFAGYDIAWVADTDHGAKYRPANDGGDYYGILRRTAGVPAVLSEAAFISNPPEEQLLNDPAFQDVEAGAIARAVVRFVTTQNPGAGFVEPYPRTTPAGPGGGADGCQDPPLQ
ncbi:MAG: N-acetylmuramoyl-L-alanine amidase [Actinomycetota bacterium]|nr:N-acetylmuramoyl-L-alanine amidase [Actinomycetota bacterium]